MESVTGAFCSRGKAFIVHSSCLKGTLQEWRTQPGLTADNRGQGTPGSWGGFLEGVQHLLDRKKKKKSPMIGFLHGLLRARSAGLGAAGLGREAAPPGSEEAVSLTLNAFWEARNILSPARASKWTQQRHVKMRCVDVEPAEAATPVCVHACARVHGCGGG